jgi:alpha-tubulin suppressor-like RCC1 family protein
MNKQGQLGDGTTTQRNGAVQVVATGITFTGIAAGGGGGVFTSNDQSHTCGLTSAGAIYCWGDNQSLQSGQPTGSPVTAPTAVLVSSGGAPFAGATQLSLGALHSCALKSDGSVWCWGSDQSGQLGNNDTTQSAYPVQVMTQTAAADGGTSLVPLANIVQVAAGELNTCARDSNGSAWCWGDNERGELGVNTDAGVRISTKVAVQVAGIDHVTDLSIGHKHTCALRNDGSLWCWGRANKGMIAGAPLAGTGGGDPTTPQPSPACY